MKLVPIYTCILHSIKFCEYLQTRQ